MERGAAGPPAYTLRRVASIALALASVIPLLLFAYTVLGLGVIDRTIAQVTSRSRWDRRRSGRTSSG
jgi:hypothetical protein